MRKRIYIAYTGGTIGMRRTGRGYEPRSGYLQELMETIPELRRPEMPEYVLNEYDPLLDSSNMRPRDWLKIGADIAANYEDFDGFIVLHGTDTMAYSASALAFMLDGLKKPVVFTGSQIPLCQIRNDARENLITSMLLIAEYIVPEVCLCFGSRLLRGCRAKKMDAGGFDAFDSPNFPHLGRLGIDISVRKNLLLPPSEDDFRLNADGFGRSEVASVRLFPGISPEILENILQKPLKGLVLESFGSGNGPSQDREFLDVLAAAAQRGVVLVNCTQCPRGMVREDYEAGVSLRRAGVVSGLDMTAEAALSKLYCLIKRGFGPEEVRRLMQENMRGELTSPGRVLA